MGAAEWTMIALAVFTMLFGIIGFFLKKGTSEQAKSIAKLFDLHDEDADKLSSFQLEIAKMYAPKQEIREMINELRNHIDQRFDQMSQFVKTQQNNDHIK